MARSCVCLSCVLCELVIQDHASRNKSLIHMFNQILVAGLPTRMHRLCVLVSITDGRGANQGRLEFCDPDGDVLVRGLSQVVFTDPTLVFDLCYEFRDVIFRKEGRHTVSFWLGEELVIMRPFTVQVHKVAGQPNGGQAANN